MDRIPRWVSILVLKGLYLGVTLAGLDVFATLAPVVLNRWVKQYKSTQSCTG